MTTFLLHTSTKKRNVKFKNLEKWIGNTESSEERIASFPANAMAATLNRHDIPYKEGSLLPPLWHWLYFLSCFNLEDVGYDGHASPGGFLPPVHLPRRMWAGSRMNFLVPIKIGQVLRKVSTVKSVKTKIGRSGQLVFVTVGHQIFENEILAIDEEHDIVYREEPNLSQPTPIPPQAPENSGFFQEVRPDPVLLFRYSALTFNGHRIHYDKPFCTESEGYQGLVVHGPLIATMLLNLLQQELPGVSISNYQFRAISTVFESEVFTLHGQPEVDGTSYKLWARHKNGTLALEARATIS